MQMSSRTAKLIVLFSFLAVLVMGGIAAWNGQANAQQNTVVSQSDATTVVKRYLKIFNAGMRSGDFSAMASVYASNATLTQSTPKGVTNVFHGLGKIMAFYHGFQKQLPGYQWTVEHIRSLAPNVILVYQHAGSPPLKVPGRCIHVFVIEHGKITSYDWATYYPGQK